MYKTVLCIILAVLLILPLCACGTQKPLKVLYIAYEDTNHQTYDILDGLKKATADSNVEIVSEVIPFPFEATNEEELYAPFKECIEKHKGEKFDAVIPIGVYSYFEAGGDPEIPVVSIWGSSQDGDVRELFEERYDTKYYFSVYTECDTPLVLDRKLGEYLKSICAKDDNIAMVTYKMSSELDKTALEQGMAGLKPMTFLAGRDFADGGLCSEEYLDEASFDVICTDEVIEITKNYKGLTGAEKMIWFGEYGEIEINALIDGIYDAIVGASHYDTGYALGRELVSIASGKAPKDVYVMPTVLTRDLLLK